MLLARTGRGRTRRGGRGPAIKVEEVEAQAVQQGQLREEDEDERGKVERKQRVVVPRVVR